MDQLMKCDQRLAEFPCVSPSNKRSVFANSVFALTLHNITTVNENQLYIHRKQNLRQASIFAFTRTMICMRTRFQIQ